MIKDYKELIHKIAKNLEIHLSFMVIEHKDILEMITVALWDLGSRNLITEENIYNSVLSGCYKSIKERTFYDDYQYINNFIRMNTKVPFNNLQNKNCLSNILNFLEKINLDLDENVLKRLLSENPCFKDLLNSFFENSDSEKAVLKNINDHKIKKILELYIKTRKVEEVDLLKDDDTTVMESTVNWYLKQIGNHSILSEEQERDMLIDTMKQQGQKNRVKKRK